MTLRALCVATLLALPLMSTGCSDDNVGDNDTTGTTDTTSGDSMSGDSAGGTDTNTGGTDTNTGGVDTNTGGVDTNVAVDTNTPPQDTAPAPQICLDHFDCLVEACKNEASDGVAACLDGAEAGCGIVADGSDAEGTASDALSTCIGTNTCVLDGSDDMYDCLGANCAAEVSTCWVGGAATGTKDCSKTRACVAACQPDIFGDIPNACLRACAADASAQAMTFFLALEFCVLEQCYDKVGTQDYDVCAQQAQNSGFCAIPATDCSGDT